MLDNFSNLQALLKTILNENCLKLVILTYAIEEKVLLLSFVYQFGFLHHCHSWQFSDRSGLFYTQNVPKNIEKVRLGSIGTINFKIELRIVDCSGERLTCVRQIRGYSRIATLRSCDRTMA
jgi:hypothetical protein